MQPNHRTVDPKGKLMSSSNPPPADLTRIERLVGEIIGLRLLLSELLEQDADRCDAVRSGALSRLDVWRIGSDTPEGADRIRTYVRQMLAAFPVPVPVTGANVSAGANSPPA